MSAPAPLEYRVEGGSLFRIIITVIVLSVGVAISLAGVERHKIMEKWSERRCDISTMMSGFLYKPAKYTGSAFDFAAENFNFCMGSLANKTLKEASIPVLNILKKQKDAQGGLVESQNSVRSSLFQKKKELDEKLGFFYDKYNQVAYLISRVGQGISASVKRIGAVIVALVYMLLSAFAGTLNMFELTIYIAEVGAGILTAIPFGIILFGWMTIPTLSAISRYRSSSAYCFARGTMIATARGRVPIENLAIGEALSDGSVVEGQYQFSGENVKLYLLRGIIVSGTHLVYCDDGRVCEVADHSEAKPLELCAGTLFCPIVDRRTIEVISPLGGTVKFADWEEVAGDAEDAYDAAVRRILKVDPSYPAPTLPTGLRGFTPVIVRDNGLTLLSGVKIGDFVLDADDKYVEVKGICRRMALVQNMEVGHTDGVVCFDFTTRKWKYLEAGTGSGEHAVNVYQLITTSGTYATFNDNGLGVHIIRDATEIGIDKIEMLTPLVLDHLNRK
jgi:hypothetical protein